MALKGLSINYLRKQIMITNQRSYTYLSVVPSATDTIKATADEKTVQLAIADQNGNHCTLTFRLEHLQGLQEAVNLLWAIRDEFADIQPTNRLIVQEPEKITASNGNGNHPSF
jgi:hypothetical protein